MEKDQNKIKDIIKSTGLLINEKRLEQGLSLEALSQKCGVTVHDLYRIEEGSLSDVTTETIEIILDALGYQLKIAPKDSYKQN